MFTSIVIAPLIHKTLLSLSLLVLFYLCSKMLNHFLAKKLHSPVFETSTHWNNVIIRKLRQFLPMLGIAIGLYFAKDVWEMSEKMHDIFSLFLSVFFIFVGTFFCASLTSELMELYGEAAGKWLPAASLTRIIVKVLIILSGTLIALHQMGISIAPLLTAVGVGGLALALGLQETLSNLFAGLYITLANQIKIGDYVSLSTGVEGYVYDISWRSTRIQTMANNMIMIPNNKIAQDVLTNYSIPEKAIITEVGFVLEPTCDLSQAERIALQAAKEVQFATEGVVQQYEPLVRFTEFDSLGMACKVYIKIDELSLRSKIRHELIKSLHKRFRESGFELSFVPTQLWPSLK